MNIITVIEKTSGVKYDIMIGTGLIFDYQNKKVFNCTDDTDEAEWSDQIFTFEIEGKEVIFYLIEVLPYDTIKEMAEVIRIQEMENDLDYMKSQGEKAFDCSGCDAEQGDVNVEPCVSCVEFCNYKHKYTVPIDPETLYNTIAVPTSQEEKEIIESQFPKDFSKKQTDFINDICGPLKETFGKYCGPLLMNEIHNKSIEHIKTIIDYLWLDEMNHFCMGFGVEIHSQDDLQNWIDVCEIDNNPEKEAMTNHVFYHLMKLKKLYNL